METSPGVFLQDHVDTGLEVLDDVWLRAERLF